MTSEATIVYISIDTVHNLAKLLGSLTVIGTALLALYRFLERDKKQGKLIKDIQEEQTLLCYGIRACLQGLAEQGCDGPVHDALDKLDKHLNQKAHRETAE